MAKTATSILDIPTVSESTTEIATASKIQLILSSDHTLRKSSLKSKHLTEEEAIFELEREKSKSVRWKEGTGLEDVMLIPPRSNLASPYPSDDMQGDYPSVREGSSSLDLTTFQSLKADCDLKEFIALEEPSDIESLDNDTVNATVDSSTERKISDFQTPPESTDSPDNSISVVRQFESSNSETRKDDADFGDTIFSAGDLQNPEKAHRKYNDTKSTPKNLGEKIIKSGKLSEKPLVVTAEGPKPPVKIIKPSKRRVFTKPTIRYSVPPFEYNVEKSRFVELQESYSSVDIEYANQVGNSKFTKGKFSVLFTEDTDYNFLCLDELFKEVSRSLRFGTRMPSEKTTGCMIDDLQTEFKPAVVNAPYGFNPTKDSEWMDLGLELSKLKYKKEKEVMRTFPLTDLNFKELILAGDMIGPLENYMIVSEDYIMHKEQHSSPLDDMMPPLLETEPIKDMISKSLPAQTDKLKILTGNPYTFPKLIIPSHTPHPEITRLRETNVHVVMDKKFRSPPSSPMPEQKPVVKIPIEVRTIYAKSKGEILRERESTASIPKPRRFMLTKSRAKTSLSVSPSTTSEFTDDNAKTSPDSGEGRQEPSPRLITPVIKYRPRAGDYTTYVKSTHWNPTPQIITKQTKMSLFKQILTEEDVIANTHALNNSGRHSRPAFILPSTLYTDLLEHNNTIVLSRADVMELIGAEQEIPKYYTSSLSPGIYVPCAPNQKPPHNTEIPQCKVKTDFHLPELKEQQMLQAPSRNGRSFLRK